MPVRGDVRTLVSKSPSLRLKIAQKPYIVWSLGPKALKYESLEPEGFTGRIMGLGFRGFAFLAVGVVY